MFVETICHDEGLIVKHIKDSKLTIPDYKDMEPEKVWFYEFFNWDHKAFFDYLKKINNYKMMYEPMSSKIDGNVPY